MIALADTMRTPDDVLSPLFCLGDLPTSIRLRSDWKRFPAGTIFRWSASGRGFFTLDGKWVLLASTVRALGPRLIEPEHTQFTLWNCSENTGQDRNPAEPARYLAHESIRSFSHRQANEAHRGTAVTPGCGNATGLPGPSFSSVKDVA